MLQYMFDTAILLFIQLLLASCTHYMQHDAAIPNPEVTELTLFPSTKPRDADPPELTLSFNVMVAPPTNVACHVDGTPVDVADLSRELSSAQYLPPNTDSPVTSITVTLRIRQAGNYQCTVSVFRASMTDTTKTLTDATTQPISIAGRVAFEQLVNNKGIKLTYTCSNSDRHTY